MADKAQMTFFMNANTRQFTTRMQAANKQISHATKMAKGMAMAMGSMFVVSQVAAFTGKLITLGAEFQKSMSRVRVLTGAASKEFAKLDKLALSLGETTQFTAREAADAMTFLAQAGFKTNEILAALPATLDLAAAGQIELAEAADIASNVLSGYGLAASEMNRVNDIMISTTNNANSNILQFAEAFKVVGPVAKSTGVDIEEISASIGLLGNAGIQGGMAGTQLRGVIASLISPSGEAAKTLERLGVAVYDQKGEMRDLSAIMDDLGDSIATPNDLFTIFQRRAFTAAAILSSTKGDISDFANTIKNDTGIAAKVAADQLDNLAGDMVRFSSKWEGLWIGVSNSQQGALRSIVQTGNDFIDWFQKHTETVGSIASGIFGGISTDQVKISDELNAPVLKWIANLIKSLKGGNEELQSEFDKTMDILINNTNTGGTQLVPPINEDNLTDAEKVKLKYEKLLAELVKSGKKTETEWKSVADAVTAEAERIQSALDFKIDLSSMFSSFDPNEFFKLGDIDGPNIKKSDQDTVGVLPFLKSSGFDEEASAEDDQYVIDQKNALAAASKKAAKQLSYENDVAIALGQSLRTTFARGSDGAIDFAKTMKNTARQIIKSSIATAVAEAIAKSISSLPMPWGIPVAAAAGAAIGLVMNAAIPELAKGGLAYGPSLAVVGDNPGARTDPEVISPLSKLKTIIGGENSNVNVTVEGVQRGEDIYYMLKRVEQRLGFS